jgi:hypothetical protein
MGWREVLDTVLEWELPERVRKDVADEWHKRILAMPPADRIALARELLAGTGFVVARMAQAFPSDVPADVPIVQHNAYRRGWNACRAAMLGEGE